jgi:hypothetical protein
MKRVRAQVKMNNDSVSFMKPEQLKHEVQREMAGAFSMEFLKNHLIDITSEVEETDFGFVTNSNVELYVMTPKEFSELMNKLAYLKNQVKNDYHVNSLVLGIIRDLNK